MCSTLPALADTVITYASVIVICCHCQHHSKSKSKTLQQKKSIMNHRNECPSPLSLSSREHSALNPVFTFFLFTIFHPLRRHLPVLPGERRTEIADDYMRSLIREQSNLKRDYFTAMQNVHQSEIEIPINLWNHHHQSLPAAAKCNS